MGIEFGSYYIKIIEGFKTSQNLKIRKFSLIKMPEGSIKDGDVQNIELVKNLLLREIKLKGYKAKKVVAVVSGKEMIVRDIKIGKMSDRMIKAALQKHTTQYLPMKKGDYQIDYKILNGVREEELEIRIVAMPRQNICNITEIMKTIKKELVFLTVPSEALEFVFGKNGYIAYEQDENIMIIDVGNETTIMTIISKGSTVLTRQIDFGIVHIHKRTYEYDNYGTDQEKKMEDDVLSTMILEQIQENIIVEMERLLQFYESNFSKGPIKTIYLIGGGSMLKGIRSYIHDVFKIPVEKISSLNKVEEATNIILMPYKHLLINILGVMNGYNSRLRRQKKQINLLLEQYSYKQQYKRWKRIIVIAGLVESLIFCAVFIINPVVQLQKAQERLKVVEEKIEGPKYRKIKEIMQGLNDGRINLEKWERQYNVLKGTAFISERVLDSFITCVPKGVTIDTLNLNQSGDTYEVTIEGNALYYKMISQYMDMLQNNYGRENIKLTINNEDEIGQKQMNYTLKIMPHISRIENDGELFEEESLDEEDEMQQEMLFEEGKEES